MLHKELVERRMRNKGEDDHLRTPYVVAVLMLTKPPRQTSCGQTFFDKVALNLPVFER